MRLYIKNMVCSRCKMVVRTHLELVGLQPQSVELGEVDVLTEPTKEQRAKLEALLHDSGFEIIDDRRSRMIEKIKKSIIELVHNSGGYVQSNLSEYLSSKLHYEYTYLSNLFSEVEGTTIEKYFIAQRIERVKELLVYDELSITEIADRLRYSSVSHLSTQFKQVTGLTPTYFKSMKDHKRRNIEDL